MFFYRDYAPDYSIEYRVYWSLNGMKRVYIVKADSKKSAEELVKSSIPKKAKINRIERALF